MIRNRQICLIRVFMASIKKLKEFQKNMKNRVEISDSGATKAKERKYPLCNPL